MNFIGRYNGLKCYACSHSIYKDAYKAGMDNGNAIFIINNVMVKENKIIGYYDGKVVREVYHGETYLKEESAYKSGGNAAVDKANTKVNAMSPKKPEPEVAKEPETAIKEICFADYSKVVDEFFALLEK
jgi:hypothetical protein